MVKILEFVGRAYIGKRIRYFYKAQCPHCGMELGNGQDHIE